MSVEEIYCHPVVLFVNMGSKVCSICKRNINVHPGVFYLCFGKILLELWPCLIYFLVDVVIP